MQYKSESRFRNQLINEMRLEGFEVQAIESGGTGRGIPDVFFAGIDSTDILLKYISGWIELKNICDDILPDPIKIDFRPGQYDWLMRYTKRGVNVYLAVSCNEGVFFFRNNEIKKEYPLKQFLEWRHLNKMKNVSTML